jgi:YD repeat-containing protein
VDAELADPYFAGGGVGSVRSGANCGPAWLFVPGHWQLSCEWYWAGSPPTQGYPGNASWVRLYCPTGSYDPLTRQCSCPIPNAKWIDYSVGCVPIVEIDRTQPPPPRQCTRIGNPIDTVRGNKSETVDLSLNAGWMRSGLTYDSSPRVPTTTTVVGQSQDPVPPSFGELWLSSLHRKLVVDTGLKGARVARGNGQVVSFSGNGAGVFTADARINDRLLSIAGGYRFIDAGDQTQESYDSTGVLTRIDRGAGQSLVFAYSTASTPVAIAPGAGYLITVTDSFGRTVQFTYNAAGLINQITDPAGQVIAAAYTGANLSQLTWQDTKTRQFLYENPSFTWALTGVIDERNIRKGTYGYDASGRAISTEGAGGVNRFSVTYTSPPSIVVTDTYDAQANVVYRVRSWQIPVAPVVATPYGNTLDLGIALVANNPVVTTRSQPAGSGCAASASNMAYDVNGNVELEDDFNGSRVCRAHDLGRNLETTRVEGLANTQACSGVIPGGSVLPALSRKVSSQWHPDWRLATKIAEPGRITTSVYNGQPDPFNSNIVASCAPSTALLPDGKPIVVLCKQVQQASTDADGALGFGATPQAGVVNRVQQWTYNQYGQALTAKDPLNNTTTYTYHPTTTVDVTQGDLATVTNAKNQVTSYTRYNKHGQVLRMVDANGVITLNTYDLRQRLLSTSVGGQTTGYTYDAAGQLTRITLPDSSWVGYEYDDAQRQKAVLDNRGNRIDYTLDNAGKRTAEAVKDPGGALRRSLARSIDALGRVQQTTGRE